MPTYYVGVGGYPKAIFPRLDALFHQHYGFRPPCLPSTILDFDEADATVVVDGKTYSIQPYLRVMPKKVLLDFARKIRQKDKQALEFLKRFEPLTRRV
jgi:hypothetical protein